MRKLVMEIKTTSFRVMAKRIQDSNKKVVIFGAGLIGRISIIEILHTYGLDDQVMCYVDNDDLIWNTTVVTRYANYQIYSPEKLYTLDPESIVLLCVSRYTSALEQLRSMTCTKNMCCYIIPMMCIHEFEAGDKSKFTLEFDSPQIPKVIHYMWLGKKPIPDELQYCISTWKKYCPDYDIVRWDETNYDIKKNRYMRQAYECGAFGFVPDYARIDILNTYGGIYLDTDVELIRSLDDLLYQRGFCGVEKWQTINLGGCSGAVKDNLILSELKELREKIDFVDCKGRQNRNTCGFYDTKIFIENGYRINGKTQKIKDMTVYSNDYFHPYDYMSGKKTVTENTHSIHHFNGGWLSAEMKQSNIRASKDFQSLYMASLEE